MTIKGFSEFVRKKLSHVVHYIPASWFSGSYVAVDANNFLCVYMATATKNGVERTNFLVDTEPNRQLILNHWIDAALRKLMKLMNLGITPVMVFDGKARSTKVATTIHVEDREAREARIASLKQQLAAHHTLMKPAHLLVALRKEYTQMVYVKPTEYDIFRNLWDCLGLPWVQAEHDSEEVCSALATQGICSGVYSRDYDCLTYGAPVMFKDLEVVTAPNGQQVHAFKGIYLVEVLGALGLSHSQFKQLAIMAGNDDNSNIHGFGVGKAYAFIKKGGSLTSLAASKDTTCLNISVCQEIYRFKHWQSICLKMQLELRPANFMKFGTQLLTPYDAQNLYVMLGQAMGNCKPAFAKQWTLPESPTLLVMK